MTMTSEQDDFLRDIFNKSDINQTGYLTIDDYLTILKEGWPLENLDENKLQSLAKLLDPYSTGRIDYQQFVNGINQMAQLQATATQETVSNSKKYTYDPDRNSNGSSSNDTFNEYDTLTDSEIYHSNQNNQSISVNGAHTDASLIDLSQYDTRTTQKNDLNVVDENYEDYGTVDTRNNDALSSSSSLLIDYMDNPNASYLLTSPLKSNIKSSKKRASESYRNSNQQLINDFENHQNLVNLSSNHTNSNSQDEYIIRELEEKIRNLENQIDHLKADKLDYIDKYSKLQFENTNLNEKLHEIEELSHELERNSKQTLENERARFNDYIQKLNIKNLEERDVLLAQLNKSEADINTHKEDLSKYIRQINDLNRIVDTKSLSEYQIEEKLNNLKVDYQRVTKEKDLYKDDLETLKTKHNQRVDALTKELNDVRNSLQQQNSKRRGTVLQTDETKVRELELELKQSRNECKHLQSTIEDLEARLLRNSLDAGKLLLTQANVPSLAAEMETLSKDELMDKLKNEQTKNLCYREYIERILAAIMEKNPEILEVRQVMGASAKIANNKSSVAFSKY